jgi:CubicO group peptidase (beta-lactamase class C family)
VCDGFSPVLPAAEWQERSPADVGLDATSLDDAMSYLASVSGDQGTEQALVVRCGYLVWQGADIDNRHNVWSVTKSFTSTVLGLLVDDGQCTTQTLAQDWLSSLQASYPDVTLGHFATMTSGYDGGGDQSDTPFSPTAPLFAPGAAYQYWDSAMNQFGNALTRVAGGDLESLFESRVAEPIGMVGSDWDWGDWGTVDGMLVNGGAGNKSRGIHVTARQLARFGLLMLHRGSWDGVQLISASWVDEATTVQVPPSVPAHTGGANGPGLYGYNWWVNGIKPDASRRWPLAPSDTYAAMGYNHNRMYVIPSWGMVIVRLGTDGDPPSDEETSTFFGMVAAALL